MEQEEQFLNFLSEDLLKLFIHSAAVCGQGQPEGLDALTNLSSNDVEEYFSEYCGDYCSSNNVTKKSVEDRNKAPLKRSKKKQTRKLALPKTDDEVVDARKAGVPIKTQKDTECCFSIWEEWRRYRNETTDTNSTN